jgi:hypothetical protein
MFENYSSFRYPWDKEDNNAMFPDAKKRVSDVSSMRSRTVGESIDEYNAFLREYAISTSMDMSGMDELGLIKLDKVCVLEAYFASGRSL